MVGTSAFMFATSEGIDIYMLVFCRVHCAFNSGAERLMIFDTFHLDSSILKCHKVMLLTVSDQIIIFLCK